MNGLKNKMIFFFRNMPRWGLNGFKYANFYLEGTYYIYLDLKII